MFGWHGAADLPAKDTRPLCTYCQLPVDGLPESVVKSREFRVVCSDGCAVALGKLKRFR